MAQRDWKTRNSRMSVPQQLFERYFGVGQSLYQEGVMRSDQSFAQLDVLGDAIAPAPAASTLQTLLSIEVEQQETAARGCPARRGFCVCDHTHGLQSPVVLVGPETG